MAQHFGGHIENRGHPLRIGLLQAPWLFRREIAVRFTHHAPYGVERLADGLLIVVRTHLTDQGVGGAKQCAIRIDQAAWLRDRACAISGDHRE